MRYLILALCLLPLVALADINTAVMTSGNQTVNGVKTFSQPISGSVTGDAGTLGGHDSTYFQPAATAITTGNISAQSVDYAATAGDAPDLTGRAVFRSYTSLPRAATTVQNTWPAFQNFSGGMKSSDVVARGPEIDVRWFGVVGDGVADDTVSLQSAATYAGTVSGNLILPPSVLLSGTVYIPIGVGMTHKGGMCNVIMSGSGTFDGGWAFVVNATSASGTWVDDYPNIMGGKISNIKFINGDQVSTRRAILFFGSAEIDNIRGRYMSQMVKRPSGVYSDNFKVSRVYSEPVLGTDYQIDLAGLGDAAIVEGCHFPWNAANPGDGSVNGVKISNTFGGVIRDCIGGNIYLNNATVSIEHGHYEKSQIAVYNSNVEIRSTWLGASTKYPIALYDSSTQNHTLSLDNVEFAYMDGVLMWQGADVLLDNRYTVSVNNSYRRYMTGSSVDKSQVSGLSLAKDDGSAFSAFNDYSYTLSRSCRIDPNYTISQHFGVYATGNSFTGLSAAGADSSLAWGGATATYYYHVQLYVDRTRLVGRTGTAGEKSVALTNSDSGARLDLDYGSRGSIGVLRVYRGTSTGSYDYYADIPVENTGRLYDDGTSVNGYPWLSRAASGVTTLNGLGETSLRWEGSKAVVVAAATPTVGTWAAGDDIFRAAPSATGQRGWSCTTGGAPGTWTSWGLMGSATFAAPGAIGGATPAAGTFTTVTATSVLPGTSAFASLGTVPAAGIMKYCTDCTTAATCAGSGTGHMAVSNGTNWTCQ